MRFARTIKAALWAGWLLVAGSAGVAGVGAATLVKDPAFLMPPETVAYAELGSPGRQWERLLNLLPGPARSIPPAWMEEWKHLRGMAVGVTQIGNPPEGVLVLYPADNDAVRQTLARLLGTALQPDGQLEGLSLFKAGDRLAVALDEDAILLGSSLDLLRDAAGRHAGGTTASSLAESQPFFSLHSASARRDNLLTAWVDADQGYRQLAERLGTELPMNLTGANLLLDLKNLKEIHGRLRVQRASLRIEIDVLHAEEHQALIYPMIRPLAWTDADLRSAPRNAAETASEYIAETARNTTRTVQRWTGVDLGRFVPFKDAAPEPETLSPIEPPDDPPPSATDSQPSLNLGRLTWLPQAIARLLQRHGAPPSRWLPGRIAAVLNHSRLILRADEDANRLTLDWTLVPIPELQALFPLLLQRGDE